MPGARCLYCELKRTSLKWTIGNTDEPLGTCRNCNTFACGHHGQRDHNVPEYMCVECVAPKLAASAVSWVEADALDDKGTTALVLSLQALYRPPLRPELLRRGGLEPTRPDWAYASFDDFLRRSPGFGEEGLYGMEQRQDYSLRAQHESLKRHLNWQILEQHRLFRLLDNSDLDLLLAAVAVIEVLNIPPEQTPDALRHIQRMLA